MILHVRDSHFSMNGCILIGEISFGDEGPRVLDRRVVPIGEEVP